MLGAPVCGSRTWMWTIVAPAPAASIEASAICAGVTGRPGCWSGLVMLPVTAQLMMTLSTRPFSLALGSCRAYAEAAVRRQSPGRHPALQRVEAADHQPGGDREAGGQTEPDAQPAEAEAEAQPERADHADRPVGDRGEQHRPARVLEAAQRTRADHLAAVEDLEQRRDREERDRRLHHVAIGGIGGIDEQADDAARHGPHDERHREHEARCR